MESKRWGKAQPKSLTLITRICTNSRRRRKLYKKETKETKKQAGKEQEKKWSQKDGETTKRAKYVKRKSLQVPAWRTSNRFMDNDGTLINKGSGILECRICGLNFLPELEEDRERRECGYKVYNVT